MTRFNQSKYKPVNPDKYVGTYPIFCRSSWEVTVARMLDMESDVIYWASEPCKIPYINPFLKKYTVYIPDFFVVYDDKNGKRHSELWEVKPLNETTMEAAKTKKQKFATALNSEKWKAAQKWANDHGMIFRIITEFDIFKNPKRR
jgi:hypothetical protein